MKTLLFVDDDALYLQMMREFLEARGYEVVVGTRGDDALEQVRHRQLGAVFLDLRMRGIDGVEVFRRIHRSHPRLPVLIVSGQSNEEEARRLLQEGAFDFIPKPVDLGRLQETVRQLEILDEVRADD